MKKLRLFLCFVFLLLPCGSFGANQVTRGGEILDAVDASTTMKEIRGIQTSLSRLSSKDRVDFMFGVLRSLSVLNKSDSLFQGKMEVVRILLDGPPAIKEEGAMAVGRIFESESVAENPLNWFIISFVQGRDPSDCSYFPLVLEGRSLAARSRFLNAALKARPLPVGFWLAANVEMDANKRVQIISELKILEKISSAFESILPLSTEQAELVRHKDQKFMQWLTHEEWILRCAAKFYLESKNLNIVEIKMPTSGFDMPTSLEISGMKTSDPKVRVHYQADWPSNGSPPQKSNNPQGRSSPNLITVIVIIGTAVVGVLFLQLRRRNR